MSLNKDFSKSLNLRVAKISCHKVVNVRLVIHTHTHIEYNMIFTIFESKQRAYGVMFTEFKTESKTDSVITNS